MLKERAHERFSLSLRSGSSGNSTYIRTDSARIAVDCGITGKQFALALRSIGEDANAVDALLLTHEHIDHCSGIGVVMRRFGIPSIRQRARSRVHETFSATSMNHLSTLLNPAKRSLSAIRSFCRFPFRMTRPILSDFAFCCRRRYWRGNGLGAFSSEVKNSLEGCRVVYLEANFDPELLESGYYPQLLKGG